MNRPLALLALALLAAVPAPAPAEEPAPAPARAAARAADLAPKLRKALVKLRVTSQSWNTTEPWKKQRPRTRSGRGVVVQPGVVLTLANVVRDAIMIEVSREGGARLYPARLKHADPRVGLALVEITDEGLRAQLEPLAIGEPVKLDDEFDIWQVNDDNLLQRATARVVAARARSTRLTLQVNTTNPNSGDGQVALSGGKVAGLLTGSVRRQEGTILSVETIRRYLKDFEDGTYDGCPGPGLWIQPLLRQDLRTYFGLADDQHGLAITRVMPNRTGSGVLKKGDVLLSVDGFDIDDEGKFIHPTHGRLDAGWLFQGRRYAGDTLAARILRDGEEQEVEFEARPFPPAEMRVPDRPAGGRPQFLVEGGLVILELTKAIGIGRSTSGVILRRYVERATWDPPSDRRRIVFVDHVLKDISNKGMDGLSKRPILEVNGRKIAEIADVAAALEEPQGDFHVFRFEGVESDYVIPIDERAKINDRIAKRYKVTRTRYLHGDTP